MFKSNYSILLVDDESCARKLIEERINKMPGVTVAGSLANGISAQKYLYEHVVDIVITDIKMPLMDGLQLIEFIQQFSPYCPRVLISGYEEFEYAKKAIRYGVKEYLLKPLNFKQIVSVVENCCREVKERRERLLFQQYDMHDALEKKLYQTFTKGEDSACWLKEVDQLMTCKGIVASIEPKTIGNRQKHEMAVIYQNILKDGLPGNTVLRLGYTQEKYEFLIAPKEMGNHRLLKAVPEYLANILEQPVKWTEISRVSSAEELAGLASSFQANDGSAQIRAACRYMEGNLGQTISREEVAERVWLSPSYFSHLFKEVMGIGYNEYLTELRVNKAKELLLQNATVSDIAEIVGFQNTRYFSSVFQKRTGYTPSEYRHAILSGEITRVDEL